MKASQALAFALAIGTLAIAGHPMAQQGPSPSSQPMAPATGDHGTIDCPPEALSASGAGAATGAGAGGPSAPATPPRTGPMITSPAAPGQPTTGTPGGVGPASPSTGPMVTTPTLPGQTSAGSSRSPETTPSLGGSRFPVEGTLKNVDASARTLEVGTTKLETDANTIVLVEDRKSTRLNSSHLGTSY